MTIEQYRVRAVIFDFDGVIVESNHVKTDAFDQIFSKYPKYTDRMLSFHRKFQSKPRMEKFSHFAGELMGLTGEAYEAERQQMGKSFSKLVKEKVINCPEVFGATALLHEFKKKIPLFVSSHTPEEELREIIRARNLFDFFSGIFGNPPTPKKDAIKRVLEEKKLHPKEVVFIGDAFTDYEAAVACGLNYIGRDSGLDTSGINAPIFPDMEKIANELRQKLA